MKIPLKLGQDGQQTSREAQAKAVERDVAAARKGDWNAKNNLIRTFLPLINNLAEKRASDVAARNRLIEAGKQGLIKAASRFTPSQGGDKFQLFALDYIEQAMTRQSSGGGLLSRLLSLFGRGA